MSIYILEIPKKTMSLFKACVSRKSKNAVMYSTRNSMLQTPRGYEEDPHMSVWSEQFSLGDQSEGSRLAFWNSGFVACFQCGKREMEIQDERSGVRPNGESYGTEIFLCQSKECGWETSFQYDDESTECWHYEAAGWPRGVRYYPVHYMLMWVDKHKLSGKVKQKILELGITGNKMLELAKEGQVRQTFGVDRKTADKICNLLQNKWGAVLTFDMN